jgi:hypothetical protein
MSRGDRALETKTKSISLSVLPLNSILAYTKSNYALDTFDKKPPAQNLFRDLDHFVIEESLKQPTYAKPAIPHR